MSKPKGPFDAAIAVLQEYAQYAESRRLRKSCHLDIPVLEAAGKVDKKICLAEIDDCYYSKSLDPWCTEARILGEIRRFLESLPDKEEEPKHYRCESCGKDFDEKIFSHSRTGENQLGDPVEVECGPISEVK